MDKNLLEAFKNYIEACKEYKKESGLLCDIMTPSDLIINFEEQEEFDELISGSLHNEKIRVWSKSDMSQPDRDSVRDLLHWFLVNSGVYNEIIYGEGFDIEKQFSKFREETEKQTKVHTSGELIGLAVGFGNVKEIGVGEFSIENRGKIWSYLVIKELTEHPNIINLDDPEEFAIFAINLYFEKPVCLPVLYHKSTSLFSNLYRPEKSSTRHQRSGYCDVDFSHVEQMVDEKFSRCEKLEEPGWKKITFPTKSPDSQFVKAIGVDGKEFFNLKLDYDEGINYETYIDVLNKAKEYFVRNGQIGNYLPHSEIDKFREFIIKVSELYQKQKYFPVAVHYFEQNDGRQLPASNVINYVTALESLYFAKRESDIWKKFAKRIANLLGKADTERSELEDSLLKTYDVRCRYVHGSIIEADLDKALIEKFGEKGNRPKFDVWLRNIVRKSILAFLSLSQYYDSRKKREELLDKLSNPFDSNTEEIQKQASKFLPMVRG